MEKIRIFDTTLRDGAQAAPETIGIIERQAITNALIELGVDVIEAGFGNSHDSDYQGIRYAAEKTKGTGIYVASLARTDQKDILAAWKSVENAENPMIHTFLSTSEVHMREKLKMPPEQVLQKSFDNVKYAKDIMGGRGLVEFSAEDATRTDLDFLAKVVRNAIKAGADQINLPDTVGYAQKGEIENMIKFLYQKVPEIRNVTISVHNHNDLGMGTGNSLEGILAGARQIECTINGVGERAGNTAMEEVVAAILTRSDYYKGLTSTINTQKFGEISGIVAKLFNMPVQLNKAIVGGHAFAHRSGVHQDGMAKNKDTYQIMDPAMYGWQGAIIVLTANSGRKGFMKVLSDMGLEPKKEEIDKVYTLAMEHISKYKHLDPRVVACMLTDQVRNLPNTYFFESMNVHSSKGEKPNAGIILNYKGKSKPAYVATTNGPISALYEAIDQARNGDGPKELVLKDFMIRSLGEGISSVGETIIEVQTPDKIVYGWGLHKDIIQSAGLAYLSALNKL